MKRYYNARILTSDCKDFAFGELWFEPESGKICFSGVPDKKDLAGARFSEERDLKGDYVIPGFKNAHTHSAMTFLRSRAENTLLWPWLSTQIFPREAKLTAEDVYWFSRLAILEYLAGGTTAAFDMYFFPDAFARACIDSGFRAVLCGSATANEDDPVEKLARLYESGNSMHPLIHAKLGFHAEYTASVPLLKELSRLAAQYKTGVFMHSSETEHEVRECLERHGKTPTELFCSLHIYDFGGGAFHGVHLSDHDLDLCREYKIGLVSCPGSNLKLASGVACVRDWNARGIPFALGTDGAASNNALNMFRETYLCTVLQKIKTDDPAALCAADALRAAVSTGARLFGLEDCISLSAGMQADFAVLDAAAPNLNPQISPVETLVYAGDMQNVKETVVAGQTRYRNGAFFVGESVERIYAETKARAERIEREL